MSDKLSSLPSVCSSTLIKLNKLAEEGAVKKKHRYIFACIFTCKAKFGYSCSSTSTFSWTSIQMLDRIRFIDGRSKSDIAIIVSDKPTFSLLGLHLFFFTVDLLHHTPNNQKTTASPSPSSTFSCFAFSFFCFAFMPSEFHFRSIASNSKRCSKTPEPVFGLIEVDTSWSYLNSHYLGALAQRWEIQFSAISGGLTR